MLIKGVSNLLLVHAKQPRANLVRVLAGNIAAMCASPPAGPLPPSPSPPPNESS